MIFEETNVTTSVKERFLSVRALTRSICRPLQTEDHVVQPVVDVSPPKWHMGHTTWFFETFILKAFAPEYREFDPAFGFLFNSYYNTVGDRVQRDHRGFMTRPTLQEVHAYRDYVDAQLITFLDSQAASDQWTTIAPVLEVGLQHEQQHQELLWTDIKYILGTQPLFPAYREADTIDRSQPISGSVQWIKMPRDTYVIGHRGEDFAFDNEHGLHEVLLGDYQIADQPVSNGEYLEFIEAGGYRQFQHWHDEGWKWVQENRIESPLYWMYRDDTWWHYTLEGLKPVDRADMLRHVSWYEASAFAAWKGMRLPTEFEWEAAQDRFSWGHRWEWTSSAYAPYPGYRKPEGAIGEYNGKFMVNQQVLRGASAATSPNHSRSTYRNFFHPHLQWQYTGIRLARSQG
ncbi:MAG: ergothioneine biosynthesis protein EgtB [Leptolyngbya sp. SIO3F4]|nr:ergothioneine biosynthesis protein EgtB [Leptolyngbya sp. SIO3F4]